MKSIILPVAELRTALAGLGKVIAKRSVLPELGCVRVRRDERGQIDLTVTDLDHTATFLMDTPDYADASTLPVPFEDLSNVAKSCAQADAITLEAVGKDTASLGFPVGGQSVEHRCDLLPSAKFPVQPAIALGGIPLPDALRDAVREALECASSDPTRLILNGAFLDVSAKGAHYVVGTDGRHPFSSNSFALALSESVLIPDHKFLGWKGFNQDGAWKLRVTAGDDKGGSRLELLSDHWRFLSRSFEGTYPNWKAMLPAASAYKARVTLDPEAVLQVMQAAQQLPTPDERHQTIGVELANNSLLILGKSQPALPWTKIEIRASEVAGPDMTLLLDRRLLLKALRFGLCRFEFIDEISPVRFSADGRQMVVMPLRPNATTSAAPQPSPRPVAPTTAEANPSPPSIAESPQNTTMPNHKHDTAAQASRQGNGASPPPARAPRPEEDSKPSLDHALVQIESIKAGFREAISGLSKLGDIIRATLREERTTDKDLQNLRQTLRSLQAVRI